MAKTKQPVKNRTRAAQSPPRDDASGRRVLAIVGAVLLIVVLVYVGWSVANDPQRQIAERTAELEEEEAVRDRQQVGELTEQARDVAGDLVPVLESMLAVMPPGEDPGPLADAETVEGWQATTADVASRFEEVPSGSTGTNVARNSIAIAAGIFQTAADTYALALEAEGEQQEALVAQAAAQRDLAVRSWSVGATQLDEINIAAGFGHQHVYLEAEGSGALTPDASAEGDGAHEDG